MAVFLSVTILNNIVILYGSAQPYPGINMNESTYFMFLMAIIMLLAFNCISSNRREKEVFLRDLENDVRKIKEENRQLMRTFLELKYTR